MRGAFRLYAQPEADSLRRRLDRPERQRSRTVSGAEVAGHHVELRFQPTAGTRHLRALAAAVDADESDQHAAAGRLTARELRPVEIAPVQDSKCDVDRTADK